MINNNGIPIIEPAEGGYWAIFPNRKVWHNDSPAGNMKFKEYDKVDEQYDTGGNWMRLKEGDNKIRIVSEFEPYGSHYVRAEQKSYICVGKENHCRFCERGLMPRVQYIGYVIDRADGRVKLLQIGHQIFSQIGQYAKNPDYAFDVLPDYDITINKSGSGLNTTYTVIPARKNTPLTDEEKKMVAEKMKRTPKEIIESRKAKLLEMMRGEPPLPPEEGEEDGEIEEVPF